MLSPDSGVASDPVARGGGGGGEGARIGSQGNKSLPLRGTSDNFPSAQTGGKRFTTR